MEIGGEAGGHVHRRLPRRSAGYFNRLKQTHNLSCVTAACLATRRQVFDDVGGFNEQDLAVCANDVDFCIRVRQAGYKVVWTPNAELYHYESLSRGADRGSPAHRARTAAERAYMRRRWGQILDNDPYFNPNLSLDSLNFALADRTRARKPWLELRGKQQLTAHPFAHETGAPLKRKSARKPSSTKKTNSFVIYDVSGDILEENWSLIERFRENPMLELKHALWIMPTFDNIYRGGINTILRVADDFSHRFGTQNTIVLYSQSRSISRKSKQ